MEEKKKKNHVKWGTLDKKRNDDLPQIRNLDYGLYNA